MQGRPLVGVQELVVKLLRVLVAMPVVVTGMLLVRLPCYSVQDKNKGELLPLLV